MGTQLELTTSDGHKLAAYRADPQGTPRGAIVVIQEIFGVNSHIRNVVDGFAADGYVAIAPAMFDRIERGVELGYNQDGFTRGRELKGKITTEYMTRDAQAAIDSVAGVGKVGQVGYCWGGFVTWMCAHHANGLACAVDYYGSGTVENGELAPRVPLMGHFSDRDSSLPVDKVQALATKHDNVQIFIYPAEHGFNCDQRGSYNADAAKTARERTLAFFRQHIG
jgi:carboxymethylenebutenolidase